LRKKNRYWKVLSNLGTVIKGTADEIRDNGFRIVSSPLNTPEIYYPFYWF
jgi:hypothetical protein